MLALSEKQIRRAKQRFVNSTVLTERGCYQWCGSLNANGYGVIQVNGVNRRAHRLSYQILVGDPGSSCVMHRCDNRRCINPDHLSLGSRAENTADMVSKGRHRGGENNPGKFPREIRLWAVKCLDFMPPPEVAKVFGAALISVYNWKKRFNKGEL